MGQQPPYVHAEVEDVNSLPELRLNLWPLWCDERPGLLVPNPEGVDRSTKPVKDLRFAFFKDEERVELAVELFLLIRVAQLLRVCQVRFKLWPLTAWISSGLWGISASFLWRSMYCRIRKGSVYTAMASSHSSHVLPP